VPNATSFPASQYNLNFLIFSYNLSIASTRTRFSVSLSRLNWPCPSCAPFRASQTHPRSCSAAYGERPLSCTGLPSSTSFSIVFGEPLFCGFLDLTRLALLLVLRHRVLVQIRLVLHVPFLRTWASAMKRARRSFMRPYYSSTGAVRLSFIFAIDSRLIVRLGAAR